LAGNAWPGDIRLVTERLVVRGVRRRDYRRVYDFVRRNATFHNHWEPTRPADFFTQRFQRRIIREQVRDPSVIQLYFFLRPETGNREIIGSVTFSNIIAGAFQSCYVGYKLDERYTGQGYMSEALAVALRYVFVHERLHRVEANIMPKNERSRRLVERIGFREEGTARRYLQIQGTWTDHIHYALLSDEFEPMGRS